MTISAEQISKLEEGLSKPNVSLDRMMEDGK